MNSIVKLLREAIISSMMKKYLGHNDRSGSGNLIIRITNDPENRVYTYTVPKKAMVKVYKPSSNHQLRASRYQRTASHSNTPLAGKV